jgi:ABC-type glutathione transport system ATPase component
MRNGVGKTTTIRILATLLCPDGGSARVFGRDVVREAAAARRLVSLTGQFASADAARPVGFQNGYGWLTCRFACGRGRGTGSIAGL